MPEIARIQQQHMLARPSFMGIRKFMLFTLAELPPARKGFFEQVSVAHDMSG